MFEGGFLDLDNIGVSDRSRPLSTHGHLEQADGTSCMAMYSLNLLAIAMEWQRRRRDHQTGWTGLVAKLLQKSGEPDRGQD